MNQPRNLTGEGRSAQPETKATLRFDMKQDESIRILARRGYEVAKRLKDIGIKFKKIIPATTDASVRKQFRLPNDSDLVCIEFDIKNKTEEQKFDIINESKDQFSSVESIKVIDEGPYSYDSNQVYRILLKMNQQAK